MFQYLPTNTLIHYLPESQRAMYLKKEYKTNYIFNKGDREVLIQRVYDPHKYN